MPGEVSIHDVRDRGDEKDDERQRVPPVEDRHDEERKGDEAEEGEEVRQGPRTELHAAARQRPGPGAGGAESGSPSSIRT